MNGARLAHLFFLLAVGPAACKHDGGERATSPPPETCAVTLPPGEFAAAPFATSPTPRSRVVALAELRLGNVQKELEKTIPTRLADEKNQDVGLAGHVNYTVDRGPFAARVEGERLLVETPLRGRAEICASGRCYADCAPEARATATIPLRLTPEYRFAPSKVNVTITRGCELRALGGMVRVDVTGMIEPQLRRRMGPIEREIDARMPDLRPQRMWEELVRPRPLPLGGCFLLRPLAIAQGPVSGTAEQLRVRFGVEAQPELRAGSCDANASAPPMPRLEHDPAMPSESDVHLALVSPVTAATAALTATPTFDLRGSRARIATADPRGARFALGLRGEVCGPMGLDAGLRWSDDGGSLRFSAAKLVDPGGAVRAGALDWDAVARAVERDAAIQPLATPEQLRAALPALAARIDDPDVAVQVTVESARAESASLRSDGVVSVVALRGGLLVKEK